jgi:exosome complex component RRP43
MLTSRTHVLPDPTAFESPLLPTTITIALDEAGQARLVRQEGLGGVTGLGGDQVICQVWGEAEKRVKELRQILDESVEA